MLLFLALTGRRARWWHGIAADPLRLHAWIAHPQVIIGYGRQTSGIPGARIAGYGSQARSMGNQTRFTIYHLTADGEPRPVGTIALHIDHYVRTAEYVMLLGARVPCRRRLPNLVAFSTVAVRTRLGKESALLGQ